MSVREYVGARYVPLFADPLQWDNTQTYEPLTIVLNQGNSYTSRQFVPTGTDISNEDYWAMTGNYNSQVEQYRQEVEVLSADLADTMKYLPSVAVPITKYGALGGDNDDTDAIQACLDNEKYVFIPSGTWNVSSQLKMMNNTVIFGEGRTSILKAMPSFPTNKAMIMNDDQISHFILSNFALDASNVPLRGLEIKNPYDNCIIDNLTGDNFCKAFMWIGTDDLAWLVSQTLVVQNCICRASTSASGQEELIHFTRMQEMNFISNKILGRQANIYPYPLVVMDSCTTSNIMECSFAFTAQEAIKLIQQANSRRNYGNKIISNMFENVGYTEANSTGGVIPAIGYPISISGNSSSELANFNVVCFNYYFWNVPKVINLNNISNTSIFDPLKTTGSNIRRTFTLNPYYSNSSNASGNVVLAPDGNMLKLVEGSLAIGDSADEQRFTLIRNSGNSSSYYGLQIYNTDTPDDKLTIQNGDLFLSKETGGNKIVMRNTNGEQYVIRVTESGQLVCEKG